MGGKTQKGWNAQAEYDLEEDENDFYITMTLNPKVTKTINGHPVCEQTLYVNGKKIDNGWYYKENWDSLSEKKDLLKCFCIGMSSENGDGTWYFGKIKCYTLRLYSRPLTETEVSDNYSKSKTYHSLLENE